MLKKLSIKNYALIDNIEISLDNGLNILTGETGAGKSIILGALSLLLGQRAESKYFFNQEKKCVIEGFFSLKSGTKPPLFEEFDLDFDVENILRREISLDGKSRAFVNDTPVNLVTLKAIGESLIAIHSQHATLELNNKAFQFLILDSLAQHQTILTSYQQHYIEQQNKTKKLDALKAKITEDEQKRDYEQFLFDELSRANLNNTEQHELEQELSKLSHAESIKKSLNNGLHLLDGDELSIISRLKSLQTELSQTERFDEGIGQINSRLKSTLIELKDICAELEQAENNTNYQPQRIDQINERLDLIYSLQKKHRVNSVEELLNVQQQLEHSLNNISSQTELASSLEKEVAELKKTLWAEADTLHQNRLKIIPQIETEVKKSLAKMAMPNACISFKLSEENELNQLGKNKLELSFSANLGQTLLPVHKAASGGELSRLMLAFKALLAKNVELPTLIFDEIDTGISGETAQQVGQVIAELADNMQILAITHLPQIASKGNSHYLVYKNEVGQKTQTNIKKLSEQERVDSIAEMLSGKNPGQSAKENAKELLNIK